MTMARMASSSAERSSLSVSPMVKPDRRSFQASSAVEITMMAAGAMVWPRPTSTPHMAVTSMAADVVSSVPWLVRTDCTFKMMSRMAVSHSTEMA